MKKQEIDIKKIITNIWAERDVCYDGDELDEKLGKIREALIESLSEEQEKLFHEFEDVSALQEMKEEEKLISFVLDFVRGIYK